MGPAGPIRKLHATGFEAREEALDVMTARLKAAETAMWVDRRSLTFRAGEVRAL